jgi:hypothetical protein
LWCHCSSIHFLCTGDVSFTRLRYALVVWCGLLLETAVSNSKLLPTYFYIIVDTQRGCHTLEESNFVAILLSLSGNQIKIPEDNEPHAF